MISAPDLGDGDKFSLAWLHNHAEAGRTEACLMCIERGTPVDGRAKDGATPLIVAVKSHRVETAFALLDRGADIHSCTNSGDTVLHKIKDKWTCEEIKDLVARGASVNAVNKRGSTPLLGVSNIDQARTLLELGAEPNHADAIGQTAIMNAAWSQNTALCKLLIDFGTDVNAYGHWHGSGAALYQVMKRNDTKAGTMLVALGAKPSIKSTGRNAEWRNLMALPPLHAAALGGHTELVLDLVSKGADINQKHRRKTPAQFAIEGGKSEAAAVLAAASARLAIDDALKTSVKIRPRKRS